MLTRAFDHRPHTCGQMRRISLCPKCPKEITVKVIANSSQNCSDARPGRRGRLNFATKMDTVANAAVRMGAIGDVIADARRVLESPDASLGTLATRLRTAEDLLSKVATDFLDLYDDASRA